MRLLLDTCTFLWITLDDTELSTTARALFADPDNDVFLSTASAFEIAVKYASGRLKMPRTPSEFVPVERERHSVAPLEVDEESALHVARLPVLHRDPFDRLLVAQAIVHGMVLVTPDAAIRAYPARTMW